VASPNCSASLALSLEPAEPPPPALALAARFSRSARHELRGSSGATVAGDDDETFSTVRSGLAETVESDVTREVPPSGDGATDTPELADDSLLSDGVLAHPAKAKTTAAGTIRRIDRRFMSATEQEPPDDGKL
jgi:hypothetical protein